MFARCVWATALHLDPPKTKPRATFVRSVGRTTNIDSTDTVYRIQHDCLLCLIIYHPENLFYFLFNGVHVITKRRFPYFVNKTKGFVGHSRKVTKYNRHLKKASMYNG